MAFRSRKGQMMAKKKNHDEVLSEPLHEARCKLSFVREIFALAGQTHNVDQLNDDAWYGLDLILGEIVKELKDGQA